MKSDIGPVAVVDAVGRPLRCGHQNRIHISRFRKCTDFARRLIIPATSRVSRSIHLAAPDASATFFRRRPAAVRRTIRSLGEVADWLNENREHQQPTPIQSNYYGSTEKSL